MEKLTQEERRDLARRAAQARWASQYEGIPHATHEGPLRIRDIEFDCAVLDDAECTRVISEAKFMSALGIYRSGALSVRRWSRDGAQIPLFLAHKNLKPFAENHLGTVHFQPERYVTLKGNVAHGIPAKVIPTVCEIWIDADREGVLGKTQKIIAAKSDILLRGFAQVGIIALVDEATGYQDLRPRRALEKILDKYLLKNFAAWAKRFPDEFYEEMFRLREWEWRGRKTNPPGIVGHYTRDLVYLRLAPGLLEELEKRNPKSENGSRKAKHHQWLSEDIGHPKLRDHLIQVITLMRACGDWETFYHLLDRALPKVNETLMLPFTEKLE